jgi:hypothetical protein
MPWHVVVISKHRADDASAESFIAALANEIMKSGAGDDRDIRVYHRSDADTDRLWLSPAAAASVPQLLTLFSSTPCAPEPELAGFEKSSFLSANWAERVSRNRDGRMSPRPCPTPQRRMIWVCR